VVERVVRVRPVHHLRESLALGDLAHLAEEFMLAVVAAVRRVLAEVLDREFARMNHLVPDPDPLGGALRILKLVLGIHLALCRDRKNFVGEFGMRDRGDERRVHAAGIGDKSALHRLDDPAKPVEAILGVLCGQLRFSLSWCLIIVYPPGTHLQACVREFRTPGRSGGLTG
jgi:hypothetical protein